jgi:hypothetical protein
MNRLRDKYRNTALRPSTAHRFRPFVEACERRELLASNNFLQGVVLDTSNNPLSGATVTLFSLPGNTQVGSPVVTGANGVYSFTGLATGQYKIVETPPSGYSNSSTSDLTHLYSTTLGTNSITVTISDGVPNALPWLVTPQGSNKVNMMYTDTSSHVINPNHHAAVGQLTIKANEQDVPFTTPSFATFCLDVNDDIVPPPYSPPDSNLPYDTLPLASTLNTLDGTSAADAAKIAFLYNTFGLNTALSPTDSAGLQLAITALEYGVANLTINSVDNPSPTVGALTTSENTFLNDAALIPANYGLTAYYLNGLPTTGRPSGSQGLICTDILNFVNSNQSLGNGETATIGFWANQNGQALINSLNGGSSPVGLAHSSQNGASSSTALGDWLASMFPNLYGPTTGTNDLKGKTNADVAAYFITLKDVSGMKTYAQILGAALAVYVTDPTLAGGTMAAGYGFKVGNGGTGSKVFSVGSNGAAFGVPNNTKLTILQLLQAVNATAVNGVVADPNGANDVFDAVNQGGDIK